MFDRDQVQNLETLIYCVSLLEKNLDNDDEQERNNADENKSKDEVVFIQDVGFSVKIISPGADPFDIQVCN